MKTIKNIFLAFFVAMLSIVSAHAQDEKCVNSGSLTAAQKEMIHAQREKIKENKEAFKAMLTKEQLAILENKEMTRSEKREALKNSFTEAQRKILIKSKERLRKDKEAFMSTLTEEQKELMHARRKAYEEKCKNDDDCKEEEMRGRRGHGHNHE